MRLLSWNVQWCRGLDGRVDPARIVHEAQRLADPDVLCLQEINVGFTDLPGSSGEDQVAALRARADSIQNDSATLERIAREKYGLIKEGERLYRFVDSAGADPVRRDTIPVSTTH